MIVNSSKRNQQRFDLKFFFLAAFLSLLSLSEVALANTSCQESDDSVPELEKIKSVFSQGNYDYFFELVDQYSPKNPTETESIKNALLTSFPVGFQKCVTLLTERKSEKLVKEVIFLQSESGDGIFLAWAAFHFDGKWVVAKYTVSTSFDSVLWSTN